MSKPRFERLVPTSADAQGTLATVRDLIRWAVSRMQAEAVALGHGTQDIWDEATWLVLWSLHLPPDRLDPFLDARLLPAEIKATLSLLERRCLERVPTAYLTGEAWLRGTRFLCDARALVPRSPIAEVLDSDALTVWLAEDAPPHRILDLCTGGGSLAILAAQQFPDAEIIGADLSTEALALASENVALHELTDRIHLRQGDLWGAVAGDRFDLILSNPPYVNAQSMAALPPEYRAEPHSALAGGTDGMDIIRRIITGANTHLETGGLLAIEIGHEAAHFEAAFPGLEFVWLPVEGGSEQIVLIEQAALLR